MTTYTAADVNSWYQAVQFRNSETDPSLVPTVDTYVIQLNSGSVTASQVQQQIIGATYTLTYVNPVIQMYQGLLNRVPDEPGLEYWADQLAGGSSDFWVAYYIGQEPEFTAYYGATGNAALSLATLNLMYNTIFGTNVDAAGQAYWLNLGLTNWQAAYYLSTGTAADSNMAVAINSFQQAQITGTEATSGSLYQYGGYPITSTKTLTTGIDIDSANFFDGNLTSTGAQTLNSGDQLTGTNVTNTLDATISSSVTPAKLSNIQNLQITATENATLGLLNATGVTSITNDDSVDSKTLTFSNIGSGVTTLGVASTASDTVFGFTSTSGVQTVGLALSAAGNSAADRAGVTIAGIENINITSSGAPNFVDLEASAASALTINGSQNIDIARLSTGGNTVNVSNVNASSLTGDLTIDMGNQSGVSASTIISVSGGAGNDSITLSDLTQTYSVTGGAGNDRFVDTAIVNADSITGGDGTDTLSTTWGSARGLTTANGVNGIDVLEVSDTLTAATLTLATVDSTINTVNLVADGAGAMTTAAATSTITGPAGSLTVNLGQTLAGYTGSLNAASRLIVQDTGTATTDSVAIWNQAVNSSTNSNTNVFNGAEIASAGYENVTLSTGTGAAQVLQTVGTLTITPDSSSAGVNLSLIGSNAINLASLTTTSTGASSIDASGLSVTSTQNGLTLTTTVLGPNGTQSITGSGGVDNIAVGNFASTIIGGAGNDVLNGNLQADSITGDAGEDTIIGAGGNDTLKGGDGNDTITSTVAGRVSIDGGAGDDSVQIGATLSSTDVVNGGDGTDGLIVTAAITGATGVGVSNFELLSTTVDQVMSNTVNNTGWTSVLANATGVDITSASNTLNTFLVNANATGGAASFARLTDTGSDSLKLANYAQTGAPGNNTLTGFTANDEESLTIDVSNGTIAEAGSLTITTLNASDLKTLTLTGDHSVEITNAIGGATSLATVDASAITNGTVRVDASNSTVAITMTGASATANTLTGGSGADSITGGTAADSLTGNNGADTLIGNGGADTLVGGQGNDSISAGAGQDLVTAGAGADSVTLSADGETDTLDQGASDSVASTATSYTKGGLVNFAAGQTITFGNGVDTVTNFLAGSSNGDVLNIGTTTSTSLLGTATNSSTIGWLSGTYNASTGVFTVAANGSGPDTLAFLADQVDVATSRAVVLVGVDSDNLVNSNFGGFNNTNLTATYAATTWTLTGQATQAIGVDATSATPNITAEAGATINYSGVYAPGAVTVLDFSGVTGGFGTTVTLNGVINALLATLTGTSGNDNYIFASEDLGAAGGTDFTATTGTDTLTLTNVDNSVTRGGGGANSTLTSIDVISLTNGTRNVGDTTTQTLTIGGALAHTVNNASATAAATVVLNAVATSAYASSSSGIDTVTLGAAGQTVTTGGGNDAVISSIPNAITSTVIMGDGAGDTLTLNPTAVALGGTISLAATAAAGTIGYSGVETVITGTTVTTASLDLTAALTGALAVTLGADTLADANTSKVTFTGVGNTATVAAGNLEDGTTLTIGVSSANVAVTGVLADVSVGASTGTTSITLANNAGGTYGVASNGVGATSIANGTAQDGDLITISGSSNFTLTGLVADVTSTVTGTTNLTLADVATLTATNTSGGIMTINAADMTDGDVLTLGAGTGAYVVNNVSDSDVGAGLSASTGGAIISGTAGAVTQNVFGTAVVDSVTIVATASTAVNVSTGAGADIISVTGTSTAFGITGGTGADRVVVGAGTANANLIGDDTGANNATGAFTGTATFDVYTGFNVGDTLSITRTAATAFTAVNTSTTDVAGQEADISFTRGVYDAVNNIFTASAVGSDSLVTYDVDAGGGADLEAIVLVGFVGSSTIGTAALPSVVTLI